MIGDISSLLAELRTGLRSIYEERLRGAYLYGSYARGDQDSESDLDVLVVLDEIEHYGAEVRRTGGLAAELSLKYCVAISTVFVKDLDWQGANSPFLVNVRGEAIPA